MISFSNHIFLRLLNKVSDKKFAIFSSTWSQFFPYLTLDAFIKIIMTKIIKILSATWLNIRKILGLNRKKCLNKCWTLLGVFSGFFERYWYDKILPNFEYHLKSTHFGHMWRSEFQVFGSETWPNFCKRLQLNNKRIYSILR